MFNGKIHYQWWFSIAMLNYQRVAHMFIVAHTNAHSIARHNLLSANISPSASQVQLQDGSQTRALRNKARATAATNLHLPSDSPIYPSSIQESNLSILHLKPGKYLNCIWINGHPGWKNATVHPNDKQSVGVSIVWWMSSLVGLNNCWRSDSGRDNPRCQCVYYVVFSRIRSDWHPGSLILHMVCHFQASFKDDAIFFKHGS